MLRKLRKRRRAGWELGRRSNPVTKKEPRPAVCDRGSLTFTHAATDRSVRGHYLSI